MSTPSSTSRPAPSKPTPRAATALSPASASSPLPPSTSSAANRSVPSPAQLPNPKLGFKSPSNGFAAQHSLGAIAMSRVGTNTSSPSAMMGLTGAFGLGTPVAGLGVDVIGGIPGGNVVPGLEAVRDQEEERRRKIEEIVAVVGRKWGRVGQEGVERCAKRVGLDCLWEEGVGGRRTLSIAGTSVLVDVEFVGEFVGVVLLSFPGSGDGVGGGVTEGAEVLRRDLKGDGGRGYVMLDKFVENLERLAGMDRLSGGGVSCFDGVDGVYGALRRIYKWEMEKLRKEKGGEVDEAVLEREVMCKSSGRPKVHTNGRVGLSVQYWMDRRLVPGKKRKAEAMDLDGSDLNNSSGQPTIYSAVIECAPSPSSIYPPIRLSTAWVSSTISKPASASAQPFAITNNDSSTIDWLEPPPTFASPTDDTQEHAMNIDPAPLSKPPDVRFVAKLEPPVVVPLQTAIEIYNSANAPLAHDSYQATTYESLLFGDDPPAAQTIHTNRTVEKLITSYNAAGNPITNHHAYTLFIQTPTYAREITEIPFSHPRQIVAILPVLRQWALIASMLRRSFSPVNPRPIPEEDSQPNAAAASAKTQDAMTLDDELSALLSPSPSPPDAVSTKPKAQPVDITLSIPPSTSQAQQLTAIFSHDPSSSHRSGSGSEVMTMSIGIALNGTIEVLGVEKSGKEVKDARVRRGLGRAMNAGESVGVGVVWLGRNMES